jgi:hypothetical protein
LSAEALAQVEAPHGREGGCDLFAPRPFQGEIEAQGRSGQLLAKRSASRFIRRRGQGVAQAVHFLQVLDLLRDATGTLQHRVGLRNSAGALK